MVAPVHDADRLDAAARLMWEQDCGIAPVVDSSNVLVGVLFIGITQVVAGWVNRLLPKPERTTVAGRPSTIELLIAWYIAQP